MNSFVVRARHVLTSGPAGHVRDGAVVVRDGRIESVGPWHDGLAEGLAEGLPVVGDGTGILAPGFVSTHGHFSEALTSGIGEAHTLWEWFGHVTSPIETHVDRETAHVGTLLRAAEAVLSGVTTAADMTCIAPATDEPVVVGVVDALEELGIRGDVSYGAADEPNPVTLDRIRFEHEALADAARASKRSRFRVGLGTVPTSSPDLLELTSDLVAEHGAFTTHLHEVREEVTASRIAHGVGSIAYAASLGLLDGQTLAAHCVWLDDTDVDLLKKHSVAVAHNPVSNMILASGVAPVPRLVREGIVVGLGLDGPASNDSQDMLETMKTAALLQRVHHLQATAFSARDVVGLATIGGARALGIGDVTGSIEPGKAADLVWLPEHSPSLVNIHDPYQKLVYCASVRDVSHVWVDGLPVVENGEVVTVDVPALLPRARELAVRLAVNAGLDSELAR